MDTDELLIDRFFQKLQLEAVRSAADLSGPRREYDVAMALLDLGVTTQDVDPRGSTMLRQLSRLFARLGDVHAAKAAPREGTLRFKAAPTPRPATPARRPAPSPPFRDEDFQAAPDLDLVELEELRRRQTEAQNEHLRKVQEEGEAMRRAEVERAAEGHRIAEEAEEAARRATEGAARRAWRRLRG